MKKLNCLPGFNGGGLLTLHRCFLAFLSAECFVVFDIAWQPLCFAFSTFAQESIVAVPEHALINNGELAKSSPFVDVT